MQHSSKKPDVLLIGAGIMSATIGTILKELAPELSMVIVERLPGPALESSDAWNNAGTGHSAFCELNYTPERPDGTVETGKAVKIAAAFELSKEFWSYLADHGSLEADHFIHRVPHMSFVWGRENSEYLKKRYESMIRHPLFHGMVYSEDPSQLSDWMPLVMEGRSSHERMAATRMEIGTDVDFGALTRSLLSSLKQRGVEIYYSHEVKDLIRGKAGRWTIHVDDAEGGEHEVEARFVFIGAGGRALTLLGKSDIPEADGFAGFPVSGLWLRCTNPGVIARHSAKVYGKAAVGSPPMSVPHLDTRVISGKKELLFGPYAGFTTKFLKQGSYFDLAASLEIENVFPMLAAGLKNLPLTKYLIEQAAQTPEDRLAQLTEYFPGAQMQDWELVTAGQRVQVIKADEKEGGILEFGTQIVSAGDGSLAALLGASPGASTAVAIMLDVLAACFPVRMQSPEWKKKLEQMIPSYGRPLVTDSKLLARSRARTHRTLGIDSGRSLARVFRRFWAR